MFEWRHSGWGLVRLDNPDLPVLEVLQQFPILLRTHITGPDDFRMINIGPIINPVGAQYWVIGSISHNCQLETGEGTKPRQDVGPWRARRTLTRLAAQIEKRNLNRHHQDTNHHGGSH